MMHSRPVSHEQKDQVHTGHRQVGLHCALSEMWLETQGEAPYGRLKSLNLIYGLESHA